MSIVNIADHMKPKLNTKLVCSSCGAPGAGSCQCGAPYITPGQRAEAAVKANPGKSDRAIAEEIGTDHKVVSRARKRTGAQAPVGKRVGKDGKARKQPKRPGMDKVKQAVTDLIAAGKSVSRTKLAKEYGVGDHVVQLAVAEANGAQKLLDALAIDPATLSMSAAAKLEVAKRAMERKLSAEHAERMRELDEVIRQRVLKETKEYLATMKAREAEADKIIETYREFINNHKPLLTTDEFNLLRKCLHQRGIAASDQDFDRAFNYIQTKKFQLTGQK
jgi:hypothetical protein